MKKLSLIFDFDGTLYDSYEGIMLAFNLSSLQLFNLERILNKSEIGPKLMDLYRRSFNGRFIDSYSNFESLFRQNYDQRFYSHGSLYDGVEECCSFFSERGYEMFVLSNKPQSILFKMMVELNLHTYFLGIYGSVSDSDHNVSKVERLRRLIEERRIDRRNCYVIGDTAEDYEMAEENECKFIHVKYGYGEVSEPCVSIESFEDLKNAITKY